MNRAKRIVTSFEEPITENSVILTHGLFDATVPVYVGALEVLTKGYRVDHVGVQLRVEGTWLKGADGVYLRVEKAEPWKVPTPRIRRARSKREERPAA